MRHLQKPKIQIEDILEDCANSYRDNSRNGIKRRLLLSADFISQESQKYDREAEKGNWSFFSPNNEVNGIITKEDMCNIYDSKFVKATQIKEKYYNCLMSLATTGKCPICGISQVSTLDHYLAKSLYPLYAVTPFNLVPVCKDCNFAKLDSPIEPTCPPLHPYYDKIDSIIWLKATLSIFEGELVVEYTVCDELQENSEELYNRLTKHIKLYKLDKAYAIQAATEIAENIVFWKEKMKEWGEEQLKKHLSEVLESKEAFQRNTWNTALLRALIENIEFLNS